MPSIVSELKSLTAYLAGLLITVAIVSNTNLDTSQIISVTTFIAIILGAIFFWRLRLAFALAGVSALLFLKVLDVPHLMKYAHFDVILFLMGMMIWGERYGAKEERYATREEFSDFKKEMKNMLSSFFGLYEELKGEALGRKIERLLPQVEEYEKPESPKKEYNYESRFVPRSECEAFKREIRDMLLSFKEDLKNFREELKRKERPFVYEEPRVIYRERPIIYEEPKYREEPRVIPRERVEAHEEPRREPERREEPEKRGVWEKLEDIPAALWVPAIVLFGFGDTLTSQLVFAAGGKEANPVMGAITAFPGGIWGFAFVKTIILVSLIFLSATFFGRQQ